MFLSDTCTNLCLIESNGSINLLWQIMAGIFLLFFFGSSAFAQWVNNPSINTKLVVDAVNPINISSVEDLKGGAFIFWEENRAGVQNEIYFLHMDGNGSVSFRADGKKVSENFGSKSNPLAVSHLPGTSVVVYKDFSSNSAGDIYAQKLLNNGNLMWFRNGVRVSHTDKEIIDYTVSPDRAGNIYISYLIRDMDDFTEFELFIQKINQNGSAVHTTGGIAVYSSTSRISQPKILADEKGGAFIFWLETQDNKSRVFAQHIDASGKNTWGKKPTNISGTAKNVISYSTQLTDYSSIYIAWQIYNSRPSALPDKEIYHQLISNTGKALWDGAGKQTTAQKGDKVNPQVLADDSTIILSWTNEINRDRNIFIQKYNRQGKSLWTKDGLAVIELKGAQFGQKLISDGKGGAIVAWIDRRVDSLRGNVYSQRITSSGKLVWDDEGIPVAFSGNTEKSYISVISDKRGGAIFIFKDKREGKGEIYGQKIFNTGTYISQIIGFTAESNSDTVKISWYSANETGETQYDVERTTQSDSSSSDWQLVGTLYSDGESSAKYYEYYDIPTISGTIYYRITQSDDRGNFQPSDIAKLNYLEATSDITIGQNSPNPFIDETVIEFYLPEESTVSVEFFNSRIEEVKKINNQHFPSGKNQLRFSADDLQPGIYFYRFKVGDFVDVKKMVITNK